MPWKFLLPAALSLFGANKQASAAESAAGATAAASDRAAKLQYQMFQQQQAAQEKALAEQRALQEPYRQAGLAGQNRLMDLLGLRMPAPSSMTGAPSVTARTGIAPTLRSEDEIRNALISQYTTGGGQVEYGREGGMQEAPSVVNEANLAAAIQGAQSQEQTALNAYRAQQSQAQQSQQMQQTAPSADFGKYARDFGMSDYQADPGYAFRLSEGMKQLGAGARASGGAVSGRTMMGAQNYAQGLASQEYQNAFNRYQTNRANQLQPLGNLMASGQSAASNQGSAAGQYGASGGNLITGAGQAIGAGQYGAGQSMAAGQLGVGNTMGNALGTIGSMYQTNQMMNRFYPVSDSSSQDMSGFQTPYIQPTYPTTTPGLGSGMYLR
jgi:hypothetical protein